MTAREAYLAVRRFVDGDLKRGAVAGNGALLILVVLAFLVLGVHKLAPSGPDAFVVGPGATVGAAWFGFVAWRGFRLLRAYAKKRDRRLDRRS